MAHRRAFCFLGGRKMPYLYISAAYGAPWVNRSDLSLEYRLRPYWKRKNTMISKI